MVTIKDVAREAGVSIGTVSNCITGTRGVTPKTAKSIQQAIARLGYQPNSYAKNLRKNENFEIGVILPNTHEQYYSFLLSGIEQELQQAGYYINLALTGDVPERESAITARFMEKNMRGILLVSSMPSNLRFFEENYFRKNIPVVFVDRKPAEEVNFATVDYYDTARYLLDQLHHQGNRRIGLICGRNEYFCEEECLRAYTDFRNAQNFPPEDGLVCHIKTTKEDAFRLGMTYLQDIAPDALLITSQASLIGLRQAAALLGITPGWDISMVCFGEDIWNTDGAKKGIWITSRPAHDLGTRAARLLLDNIQSPLTFKKQQIVLTDKVKDKWLAPEPPALRQYQNSTLSLCLLDLPKSRSILRMRGDFFRKTGIHLEIELCSHPTLLQRILDFQNAPRDLYMYDNPWLAQLQDCFEDITPFLHSDRFDTHVFLPDLIEKVGTMGNATYGIPILYGPQLLLYRKDLFEHPDLRALFEKQYRTPLRLPRTWFEFNVLCKFFTRTQNPASPVPYGTSIASGSCEILLPEFLPRMWAYGAQIVDDGRIPATDTPQFKKALTNFIETFAYTPSPATATVEQTVEDFYHGNTAMFVGFASFIADVNNYAKSDVIGKIGYANIPGNQSVLGSWGLGIAKGCPQKEKAFEFLKWISDDALSNYFAILDGQSPLESVYRNDEMTSHYPWLSLICEGYPFNRKRESLHRTDGSLLPVTTMEDVVYRHITRLLQHDCTVEEAAQCMQIELRDLL